MGDIATFENKADRDLVLEALAALKAIGACIVDEGGFPRFNVSKGRNFDAACLAVKAVIASAEGR